MEYWDLKLGFACMGPETLNRWEYLNMLHPSFAPPVQGSKCGSVLKVEVGFFAWAASLLAGCQVCLLGGRLKPPVSLMSRFPSTTLGKLLHKYNAPKVPLHNNRESFYPRVSMYPIIRYLGSG